MASETTRLVPPNNSKHGTHEPPSNAVGNEPTAYFIDGIHRRKSSIADDTSFHTALGEEVDNMPKGAVGAEFNPRPVGGAGLGLNVVPPRGSKNRKMRKPSVGGGWMGHVADSWKPNQAAPAREDTAINAGEIGTLVLPRKVPIKVEPKVHFANERTFLAWLHLVLILAGASILIVGYAPGDNIVNQLYGIILLPVSVAFIFYALFQYVRRARMIHHHEPGPFIDVAGPTTLTVILMASIIAQFSIKLHSIMYYE